MADEVVPGSANPAPVVAAPGFLSTLVGVYTDPIETFQGIVMLPPITK